MLIEALALLPRGGTPYHLSIAGDGADRAALEARAAALALEAVHFAGYADDPRAFLGGLHFYVQPSRSEGLCVAAHEAMQAGLPVLASAVGQLPYSIVAGRSGSTVPPAEPQALADALAEMLATPDRLGAMGAAARTDVIDRFGPDRFRAAGLAVLNRLRDF